MAGLSSPLPFKVLHILQLENSDSHLAGRRGTTGHRPCHARLSRRCRGGRPGPRGERVGAVHWKGREGQGRAG